MSILKQIIKESSCGSEHEENEEQSSEATQIALINEINNNQIKLLSKVSMSLHSNSKFGKLAKAHGWDEERKEAEQLLEDAVDILNSISIDIDNRKS